MRDAAAPGLIPKENGQHIVRVGHRGAAGHAPENTIAAIYCGISLGVDFIELDVRCSRDGRLVVMHDHCVDRTTNGSGPISDLTWEQLQLLDAGDGESVPCLEAALAAASGRAGVMLEVKTTASGPAICTAVQASAFSGRVVYASFLHAELAAIRRIDPMATTIALVEKVPLSGAVFARDAEATLVGLSVDSVTAEHIATLHDAGLGVWCFTVNEPQLIRSVVECGVEGIISDYPERVPKTW